MGRAEAETGGVEGRLKLKPSGLSVQPYSLDVDKILEHKDYFRVCLERQARFYRWKPHQLIANLVTAPLVVLRTLLRR